MKQLPQELIGLIINFATTNDESSFKQVLLIYVCVSRDWAAAVIAEDPLWLRLTRLYWPETKEKHGRYEVFRARMLAAKGLTPIAAANTHPIEECTFEYQCPLLLERLTFVEPGKYYCGVCKENVFAVSTQGELDQKAAEARCVFFQPTQRFLDKQPCIVIDIVLAEESGSSRAPKILAELRARADRVGSTTSIAVNPESALYLDGWRIRSFHVDAEAAEAVPWRCQSVAAVLWCGLGIPPEVIRSGAWRFELYESVDQAFVVFNSVDPFALHDVKEIIMGRIVDPRPDMKKQKKKCVIA